MDLFSNTSGASWPAGLELYLMRHGLSTWNDAESGFKAARKAACASCGQLIHDGADICTMKGLPQAAKTTEFIQESDQCTQAVLNTVQAAAQRYLHEREKFDAPLDAQGLLDTLKVAVGTEQQQKDWLKEHLDGTKPMALVTSNLIRAIDTLLNSLPKLTAASANPSKNLQISLVTSLQEFSQSGNSDPVAVYMPKGLQQALQGAEEWSSLDSNEMWTAVAHQRYQGYLNAKAEIPKAALPNSSRLSWGANRTAGSVLNITSSKANGGRIKYLYQFPWAAKGNHQDMQWWLQMLQQNSLQLVSAPSFEPTRILMNHDLYRPNSDILSEDVRVAPQGMENLNMKFTDEYEESGKFKVPAVHRFQHFKDWMLAKNAAGIKRIVVAGHSNWYKQFFTWMLSLPNGGMGLDSSCEAFKAEKMNNLAMMRIVPPAGERRQASCECVFDPTGGACVGGGGH
jgi:hypothetical protein